MKKSRVSVIKKTGRANLYLLARNGETGERFERSAGTTNRKEAEKLAVEWRIELEQGYRPELITWTKFIERFDSEHLSEIRGSSREDALRSLRMFQEVTNPARLRDINETRVAAFRKRLQERQLALTTVAKHLRNIRTAVNWATDQKLLPHPPKIRMPKVPKGSSEAKGRPATREEFERLLAIVPRVVAARRIQKRERLARECARIQDITLRGEALATLRNLDCEIADIVKSWTDLLHGLWWSGLRLGEALSLSWDEWHDGLTVDTSGEFVLLRVPAEHEKGGRNRLLPIAPEFAEMLRAVPEDQRTGFVFNPRPTVIRKHARATLDVAKHMVSRIGKRATVVVTQVPKIGFASAHDLRRSFGHRWSRLVTPAVLKELMRHSNINTTMKYYVGSDADETARLLQKAMPDNHSVDTPVDTPAVDDSESA